MQLENYLKAKATIERTVTLYLTPRGAADTVIQIANLELFEDGENGVIHVIGPDSWIAAGPIDEIELWAIWAFMETFLRNTPETSEPVQYLKKIVIPPEGGEPESRVIQLGNYDNIEGRGARRPNTGGRRDNPDRHPSRGV